MKTSRTIIVCIVMLTICGCGITGTSLRLPTKTAITDTKISASRDEVFDGALVVSQYQSLNVGVLEKDSGLIRFDAALLTAFQLDRFCKYPLVNNAGQPYDTFARWSTRSLRGGTGPVNGNVSLTILITDDPVGANLNIRSIWTAYSGTERFACNSTGVFEKDFVNRLTTYLSKDTTNSLLLQLDDLRQRGILTQAEFDAEKKEILEGNY